MNRISRKPVGTRRRARLSALLCLAFVLGALPGTVWAGSALNDDAPVVAITDGIAPEAASLSVGFVGWKAVSAGGAHSLGIKEDGTLWAWGYNDFGQLGNGTTASTSVPVQVGSGNDWKAVSAGSGHSFGTKEGGTLWAWGGNSYGQLGNGTNGPFSGICTPILIGAAADRWKTVSAGNLHSLGIKEDGTLWAWGRNDFDQLGNGMSGPDVNENTPILIDGPGKHDMPITATVKDRHAPGIGKHGDGFTHAEAASCACHAETVHGKAPIGTASCTDVGCHRVAAAREIYGDPPENHAYITTYSCDACHRITDDGSKGTIERIAGADRFATAIKVSQKNFESADTVIIATGMDYADALSASALAGSEKAPLLLTATESLSNGVLDEVQRLGAKKVYIMGSAAAVSNAVAGSLTSAGLSVERVQGADRYATSAAIAQKVMALEGPSFAKKAFLTRGDNFADGLAVSPLAYRNKVPVILTRPTELSLPAAGAITGLGIDDVTILGSAAAVSVGAENAVRSLGTGPTVRRVAGIDRYETAQKIAEHAFDNSLAAKEFIGVADGLRFSDALAGGVATGERGGILVLTVPAALSPVWAAYLPSAYGYIKPDIQLYGGWDLPMDYVRDHLRGLLL